MTDAVSTTRWRSKPMLPANCDDVPALVKTARRLRQEIVEFEWVFTRDELLSLRRAIFEWDSHVVGTYRAIE